MKYIKYFETEHERQSCSDTYKYMSYTVESQLVNIHKEVPPFFCKLTLNNDEVVEIEGSGELTQSMVNSYKTTAVKIELGELCNSVEMSLCMNWTSLTELKISNAVKSIADIAFLGTSLTEVILPNNNISIGNGTFANCTALTTVSIPNSITNISPSAFSGCTSLPVVDNIRYADTFLVEAVDKTLSTYTIKEGTRFIGYDAFMGCESLTNITIPNSVIDICSSAFMECPSLPVINSIRYADTCAVMAVDLSLETYTLKEGTKFIGSCFNSCEQLTHITIPDTVISICDDAFSACPSLLNITIPNSVIRVGNLAFEFCESLTNVTLSNNITVIPVAMFGACTSLTNITLPSNIKKIERDAFYDCSSLSAITSLSTLAPSIAADNPFDGINVNGILYVPQGSSGYDAWLTVLGEGWTMEYIS